MKATRSTVFPELRPRLRPRNRNGFRLRARLRYRCRDRYRFRYRYRGPLPLTLALPRPRPGCSSARCCLDRACEGLAKRSIITTKCRIEVRSTSWIAWVRPGLGSRGGVSSLNRASPRQPWRYPFRDVSLPEAGMTLSIRRARPSSGRPRASMRFEAAPAWASRPSMPR